MAPLWQVAHLPIPRYIDDDQHQTVDTAIQYPWTRYRTRSRPCHPLCTAPLLAQRHPRRRPIGEGSSPRRLTR